MKRVGTGILAAVLIIGLIGYLNLPVTTYAAAGPQILYGLSNGARTAATTIPFAAQTNVINSVLKTSTTGTFSKFYAQVSTAPGSGNTWTVTVQIPSGSNSPITCSITGSATSCSDLVDATTTTSANQTFVASWAITGTPASAQLSDSIEFAPSTSGQTMMDSGILTNATLDTWTAADNGANQTVRVNAEQIFPEGGTLLNEYAAVGISPGSGTSVDFSALVNNATTTITCNIANTNISCNDTTHTASITAGQDVYSSTNPNSSPAARTAGIGYTFTPTNAGDFMLSSEVTTVSGSGRFYPLGVLTSTASTVEASSTLYADTMTVTSVRVDTVAPTGTKSMQFVLRKNNANLDSCTVTGSATSCTMSVGGSFVQGDTFDVESVPTGSPAIGLTHITAIANDNTSPPPPSTGPSIFTVKQSFIIRGQTIIK